MTACSQLAADRIVLGLGERCPVLGTIVILEAELAVWRRDLNTHIDTVTIFGVARFQQELSDMGYKYQFITLAGIHNMWYNMFDLAYDYARGEGMKHYVEKVQEVEFAAAKKGYTFVAHQQEVGTGYFDKVTNVIQGGESSVTALTGSTEEEQF